MTGILRQKQEDQFRSAAYFIKVSNPINSEHDQDIKQNWSPSDPAFECAFNTPIDLTKLGTKKDFDNESFLLILGSPSDRKCGPLHGN